MLLRRVGAVVLAVVELALVAVVVSARPPALTRNSTKADHDGHGRGDAGPRSGRVIEQSS